MYCIMESKLKIKLKDNEVKKKASITARATTVELIL